MTAAGWTTPTMPARYLRTVKEDVAAAEFRRGGPTSGRRRDADVSAHFDDVQVARELGAQRHRIAVLEDLVGRLAEVVERIEGRVTVAGISLLDRDEGPSVK